MAAAAAEAHGDDLTASDFMPARGADVVNVRDADMNTPLHKALESGHVAVAARLLAARGCDVDASNGYGLTPADVAAPACLHLFE